MQGIFYSEIIRASNNGTKLLAVLIDPEKFDVNQAEQFIYNLPEETTHLFVGGSTDAEQKIEEVVKALKQECFFPIFLFPGSHQQITDEADALLFLSLHSGRNSEYLIGQQVKAAPLLKDSQLEIIATSYLLIDGGHQSAVALVSETKPMQQENVTQIVDTAIAGQLMGAKLVYLEAGSGAIIPVSVAIIKAVKNAISIPLIVGGGIRSSEQRAKAYKAGADLVVMGTVFEG